MRIAPLLLLVLVLAGLTSCRAEENWNTSIYATGGVRQLKESEWSPIDTQPMIGLEGVGRSPHGIWGVEFGGAFSYAQDTTTLGTTTADIDGQVFDLYLGPRLTFFKGRVRPFLSGGLVWGNAKASSAALGFDEESSSQSAGGYGRAGIDFFITDHISLGVDARYVFGTHYSVETGDPFDTDGVVGAFRFGWSF